MLKEDMVGWFLFGGPEPAENDGLIVTVASGITSPVEVFNI